MGAKGNQAVNGGSSDRKVEVSDIEIGEKRNLDRDEDGNLEGTKGLDNAMLL
jgi:hypothetical protein